MLRFDVDAGKFQPTPSSRRVTSPTSIIIRHVAYISTNTLLAEGDWYLGESEEEAKKFQPTPSSRRVTRLKIAFEVIFLYFNQHPPRGG